MSEAAEIIRMTEGGLEVPCRPIIPFIEGDGVGKDIWPVARRVFDSAVKRAYGDERRVVWREVLAGGKAHEKSGEWLPEESFETLKEHLVAIKGPLMTPVGEGFRSINVTLRQRLDLFVCLRPVKYYEGLPSPVRHPERVNIVVFRENTEDVYAGLELPAGDERTAGLISHLEKTYGWKIRSDAALGVKPISVSGSERLIRAAIRYAIEQGRRSVTLVHKGNIQKFTEGGFRRWGYELARREFGEIAVTKEQLDKEHGGALPEGKILIQDVIADAFLQRILLDPASFDVVATMNLNGDYVSDALAAQVGGIGIAPGGNINYDTGHAIFEATHGTAPDLQGKGIANPSSLILSGRLMFDYLGWSEAAELIESGLSGAIRSGREEGRVTADVAPLLEGAEIISTEEFGERIVSRMS